VIQASRLSLYRRCIKEKDRSDVRVSWNFWLQQIIVQKIDPYAHLDKFLNEDELKTAIQFCTSSDKRIAS
jgi:hypothetical protein